MKQFKFFCNVAKIFPSGRKKISIVIETSSHPQRETILRGLYNLGVKIGYQQKNNNYVSIRLKNEVEHEKKKD